MWTIRARKPGRRPGRLLGRSCLASETTDPVEVIHATCGNHDIQPRRVDYRAASWEFRDMREVPDRLLPRAWSAHHPEAEFRLAAPSGIIRIVRGSLDSATKRPVETGVL